MKTRSRMSGVVLALALSLGGTLAACGGSDGSDGSSDKTESTPSATASEPAATAETATEPTAEPEAQGDKPSKDEVVAGYKKVLKTTAGANLPDDIVDKVVTCFADELYDTASPKTLQAIADAQPANVDPADTQAFSDASTACTKKITGQ